MDYSQSSERPQFRLQTLFFATTLVAVGIGLFQWWDTSFVVGVIGLSILFFCGGAFCMMVGDLHEAAGCIFHLVGVVMLGAAAFLFSGAVITGIAILFFGPW